MFRRAAVLKRADDENADSGAETAEWVKLLAPGANVSSASHNYNGNYIVKGLAFKTSFALTFQDTTCFF